MNKSKSLATVIIVVALLISGSLVFASLQFKNNFEGDTFKKAVRTEIEAYVKEQQKAYEDEMAKQQAEQQKPKTVIGDFSGSGAVLGEKDAPITIIEFSDFQCPYCRKFYNGAYQDIKKNYVDTGKVKIVFRNYPLTDRHPDAYKAAMAVECARGQGGDEMFFEMHDKIFGGQTGNGTAAIPEETLVSYAKDLKLDTVKFEKCVKDGDYADLIKADIAAAEEITKQAKLDGFGTPTLIVNGSLISGAYPFNYFQVIIDNALEATTTSGE